MSLENKIKKCIWKGCLILETRAYGRKMKDYDLVINRGDSFLYKNCKDCNGKNSECKFYYFRKSRAQ